jgi:hypothetical protein
MGEAKEEKRKKIHNPHWPPNQKTKPNHRKATGNMGEKRIMVRRLF